MNHGIDFPFGRLRNVALIAGLAAAVVSVVGAVFNRAQFFHSYLFAWLFWAGLSLGSLVVVMMQSLTGGDWGRAVRGLAVAAFRTLPAMALLFVPILFGLADLYSWVKGFPPDFGPHQHKAAYLTVPFFIVRSCFYLAVLIALAAAVRRQERGRRLAGVSAAGLIIYVMCMNFASTDWVMSLNPKWYSTIFVEVFASGQFLSALALLTAMLALLHRTTPLGRQASTKTFHDLGNMLLAFVIFWTYVGFSQFLIIWSGNLPREISWYLDRSRGGWQWIAVLLLMVAFVLPFALLLSREAKRNPQRLLIIAMVIMAATVLMNFWFVAPSFHPGGVYVHWQDVIELVALGGFWFALFFHFANQQPLVQEQSTERKSDG
jgi:hypothetical protein